MIDRKNMIEGVIHKVLPLPARSYAEDLFLLLNSLIDSEMETVCKAVVMASNAHKNQKRKSGEPYIIHPIEVAKLSVEMGLDFEAVCAALLHDVVEDTEVSLVEIEENFGKNISSMVDALTKISAIKVVSSESKDRSAKAETLRKMMLAMSRDIRVILIKLCDRLHNLRTINVLSSDRRHRIANETMEIYAPIASRLGLNNVWAELMDLSFKAKNPWRYKVLSHQLEKSHAHRRNYIEAAVERVKKAMSKEGIEAEVYGRRKSVHSVYMKMKEKKLRLKDVHDREGFRVIVTSKSECYMSIGILHELWKPIPGYFKDYIAIPKLNGYQSLHTALLNEQGDPMEVQVRTSQMHKRAEDGIASHWVYKSKESPEIGKDSWGWLQALLDIQASSSHADDYLEHVKTDLFSEEVYIFTPTGEVIALPRGASALDFGFGIHSDIGMRALDAKVNGEKSDLSRKLRSGDIVAINTAKDIQAVPMWLTFAKTGRAKSHIRAFLRSESRPKIEKMGLDLLVQALSQLGVSEEIINKDEAWSKAFKRFHLEKLDLLAKIGSGSLSSLAVGQVLAKGNKSVKAAGGLRPVSIGGDESEYIHMARCCCPLPPQNIVGILNHEEGLFVHRMDCSSISKQIAKDDYISVIWEESALTQSFSASIKIRAKNERGTLGRIAALVASMEADVNNIKITGNSVEEDKAVIDIDIQIRSKFHLDRVVEALSKDNAVINVF